MTNADKFKGIFGIYATELWAKPEKEFLDWLNEDVPANSSEIPNSSGNHFADSDKMVGGDMISRQAAAGVVSFECGEWRGLAKTIINKFEALPSAQQEPIRINLNEPIKVKLTDWGKEIYYHQYDRTNQIAGREICKPRFPREDENGYTEFQLWCFIELYGMHMGMTLPNVIEPLEIVYER